jgi:hypothetical protein
MVGVAARPLDADHARRHAVIVQAFAATRAFTAARPWVDETVGADGRIACFRPSGDNSAERLMAQRHRRLHAAFAHLQAPATTEIEVAFPDVHIAVTHAAVFEAHEHLGAARHGRFTRDLFEWLTPFDNVIAQHGQWVLTAT